ncbi:MAG: hypothetical protein IPM60_01390 [Rhodospirillales bacterium]|nr:hypothetical protein [Rhodospirillales bacterium]
MPNTLPDGRRRPVVTFEVLFKQHNGQWQGRGTFAGTERELAIDTARALEQDLTVALVKVVKETYDPATNATEETTVYRYSAAAAIDEDALQARRARAKAREDAARAREASRRRRRFGVSNCVAGLPALVRAFAAGCCRLVRFRRYRTPLPATGATTAKRVPTLAAKPPQPACAWAQQKRIVSGFLRGVADRMAELGPGADNDIRLGLCFYICGACSAVIEHRPMTAADANGLIADCLSVLRLPRQRALQFAADREVHVAESPRFRTMFDLGHAAMLAYLRTSTPSADSLTQALRTWSAAAPQMQPAPRRHVTIVLTEILHEPAAMADSNADSAARDRQVHDRICDSVLRRFKGAKAGHAPRGMAAVFDDPTSAVKCAVLIQRCVDDHNAGQNGIAAEGPVSLRIAVVDQAADTDGAAARTGAADLARTMIATAEPGRIVCTDAVRRAAEALNLPCAARAPLATPERPSPVSCCEIIVAPRGQQLREAAWVAPTASGAPAGGA